MSQNSSPCSRQVERFDCPSHPIAERDLDQNPVKRMELKWGVTKCFYQQNFAHVHQTLTQRSLTLPPASDKLFSSIWLGEDRIIAAGKSDELLLWNIRHGRLLPRKLEVPYAEERPLRRGGSDGIHSLSLSPNESLLLCGGYNPNELVLLETTNFSPLAFLQGSKDLTYSTAFLNSEYVLSGCKDGSLRVWSLHDVGYNASDPMLVCSGLSADLLSPLVEINTNQSKVRALAYHSNVEGVFSLGSNGSLSRWDLVEQRELSRMILHDDFTPALAIQDASPYCIVVGGAETLQLIDWRTNSAVGEPLPCLDIMGARSLSFHGSLVTIGGGYGTLTFLDVRKGEYLTTHKSEGKELGDFVLETSACVAFAPEVQLENGEFLGGAMAMSPAAFTHCYDHSKTRLFVGGGPITAGMMGSYAGLWL